MPSHSVVPEEYAEAGRFGGGRGQDRQLETCPYTVGRPCDIHIVGADERI